MEKAYPFVLLVWKRMIGSIHQKCQTMFGFKNSSYLVSLDIEGSKTVKNAHLSTFLIPFLFKDCVWLQENSEERKKNVKVFSYVLSNKITQRKSTINKIT